ncbi:MAG: autotransporter outer membrane beta-barrel domain-containing protein [Candidatus Rhabdochlamydia sp.]
MTYGRKHPLRFVVIGIYLLTPYMGWGAVFIPVVYERIFISSDDISNLTILSPNYLLFSLNPISIPIENQGGSLNITLDKSYFMMKAEGTAAIYGDNGGSTQIIHSSSFSNTRSQITATDIPEFTGVFTTQRSADISCSKTDIKASSPHMNAYGAFASNAGTISLQSCNLALTGPSCYGLVAYSVADPIYNTRISFSNGQLLVTDSNVSAQSSTYGMDVKEGGQITLIKSLVTMKGYDCYGARAEGLDIKSNPSTVISNGSSFTIDASGDGYGAVAKAQSSIQLIESPLDIRADNCYGLEAQGASKMSYQQGRVDLTASKSGYLAAAISGAAIDLQSVQADVIADSCYGVVAKGISQVTGSGVNMNLKPLISGWGAQSSAGGSITLADSSIILGGEACYGVMATGKVSDSVYSQVTCRGSTIDMTSIEIGCAALAEKGGVIELSEGPLRVRSSGTFSQYGLKAAQQSLITANDISVQVAGQGSLYGAYATERGRIHLSGINDVKNIVIQSNLPTAKRHSKESAFKKESLTFKEQPLSAALYAEDYGIISTSQMNLIVDTEGGIGVYAVDGGVIGLYQGNIELSQPSTCAVHLESSAMALLNSVNIINTQEKNKMESRCGIGEEPICKGIISTQGTNQVILTNTTFQGDFPSLVHVENSYLRLQAEQSTLNNNKILGYVNGGNLDLDASYSQLQGDLEGQGSIVMTLSNQSLWRGKLGDSNHPSTQMHISNSKWEAIGDVTLSLLDNNQGVIELVPSSHAASIHLVIDEYQGGQGDLILNTALGFQNSASDLMTIHHYAATHPTAVTLQNRGGVKGTVLSHTTPLVQVSRQESLFVDKSAFFLKDFIGGDSYNYTFQYDPSNPDWHIWNLQLESHDSNSSLYANLPATALSYGLSVIDSLHERMGSSCFQLPQEKSSSSKVWSRLMYEKGDITEKLEGAAVKRIPSHFTNQTVQVGSTLYHHVDHHLHQEDWGIMASLGEAICHIGDQDLLIGGKNKIKIGSLASYFTHYGPLGGYVDAILQGNYYDAIAMNPTFKTATKGVGLIASLEGGLPFDLGEKLTLEPQAKVMSQFINFNSFTDGNGKVKLADGKSVVTKVGLRGAKQWAFSQKKLSFWTQLGGSHEFLGSSKATLDPGENGLIFSSKMIKSWADVTVGLDVLLNPLCSLYGSGGYSTNFNASSSYNLKAGMKWTW